jgi:hypothetical protein
MSVEYNGVTRSVTIVFDGLKGLKGYEVILTKKSPRNFRQKKVEVI